MSEPEPQILKEEEEPESVRLKPSADIYINRHWGKYFGETTYALIYVMRPDIYIEPLDTPVPHALKLRRMRNRKGATAYAHLYCLNLVRKLHRDQLPMTLKAVWEKNRRWLHVYLPASLWKEGGG